MTHKNTMEERFDALDIHISPAESFADKELRYKIKLYLPIAFDLLKPSIKKFIRAEILLERNACIEEVRKEWLKLDLRQSRTKDEWEIELDKFSLFIQGLSSFQEPNPLGYTFTKATGGRG